MGDNNETCDNVIYFNVQNMVENFFGVTEAYWFFIKSSI